MVKKKRHYKDGGCTFCDKALSQCTCMFEPEIQLISDHKTRVPNYDTVIDLGALNMYKDINLGIFHYVLRDNNERE